MYVSSGKLAFLFPLDADFALQKNDDRVVSVPAVLVEVLGLLDVLEVDGFCDAVDDLVFLDLLLFGVFVLEDLANHVLKQDAPHVGPEGFLHDVLGERIQLCVVGLHDAVQGPKSLRVREQSLFAEVVVHVEDSHHTSILDAVYLAFLYDLDFLSRITFLADDVTLVHSLELDGLYEQQEVFLGLGAKVAQDGHVGEKGDGLLVEQLGVFGNHVAIAVYGQRHDLALVLSGDSELPGQVAHQRIFTE